MTPILIFYNESTLLEGPCWDPKENVIYFVSIEQCLIYSLNLFSGAIKSYQTNGHVGCVVIDNEGMLISAEKEGVFKINPKTNDRLFINQFEEDVLMRYNDGIIDPNGRFIVGTKGYSENYPGKAKLFSFDGENFKTIVSGTTISNGLGFSKTEDKMYFIDSPTKKVGKYSYNVNTGEAMFDNYIIEIDGEGYPDGMCVDIDDMIWVAEWGGGKVCKWNPKSGKKIIEIILPCINVTSCCLGGEYLEYLFVTTAKNEANDELLAGGLFKIKIR
jgi:sugar lactone lactonase YvrE